MESLNERIKRRKRQARRRRWRKRLTVCAALAMMAILSSWRDRRVPESAPKELPDPSALAWMVTQSWLSPANARDFARQYPELADLFLSASAGPAPWEAR